MSRDTHTQSPLPGPSPHTQTHNKSDCSHQENSACHLLLLAFISTPFPPHPGLLGDLCFPWSQRPRVLLLGVLRFGLCYPMLHMWPRNWAGSAMFRRDFCRRCPAESAVEPPNLLLAWVQSLAPSLLSTHGGFPLARLSRHTTHQRPKGTAETSSAGACVGGADALQPLQPWEPFPCLEAFAHFPPRYTPATPQTSTLDSLKTGSWGRGGGAVSAQVHKNSWEALGALWPWEEPTPGRRVPFHSVLPPGRERQGWTKHAPSAQEAHHVW